MEMSPGSDCALGRGLQLAHESLDPPQEHLDRDRRQYQSHQPLQQDLDEEQWEVLQIVHVSKDLLEQNNPAVLISSAYINPGNNEKMVLVLAASPERDWIAAGASSAADLVRQTEGVICRKDKGVVDEIPGAYKDIDTVMANQADLVDAMHTLKQVVCVKG